jgi:formate dehydrogenase maturation protein FdhE
VLQPVVDKRWSERRERARALAERWSFAAEVLLFYATLLDVQERAFEAALEDRPQPDRLAAYATQNVLPKVIEASVAHGPPAMTETVLTSFHETDFESTIEAWLRGESLAPVERYLARAASGPILEALGAEALRERAAPAERRRCPVCGGAPQVSYFAPSSEDLVTARRYLVCSRCANAWPFARLTCAGCGETETKQLVIYGEVGTTQAERSEHIVKARSARAGDADAAAPAEPAAQFPHLRIDGCRTCSQFLLTIDLERDRRAVPLVDEIAAIPLSLYAAERGLNKIVPNLVGF